MREIQLQQAWGGLYFDFKSLKTQDGKPLQLLQPGHHNRDAGPDFSGASMLMDHLHLQGDVEIHVRGDEWYRHGHHQDPRYNSVMLHVVWEPSQRPVMRQDGTTIPELALKGRLPEELLGGLPAPAELPCHGLWMSRRWIDWQPVAEELGLARMRTKAEALRPRLLALGGDRRQLLWEEVAAGMGGMQNREAFRQMAQAVPRRIWESKADSLVSLEALFLGAAGLLAHAAADPHTERLLAEWRHLAQKHSLQGAVTHPKSLRMRPGSLPHVRLAQLAALVHQLHFLEELLMGPHFGHLLHLEVQASAYWDTHHVPREAGPAQPKRVGKDQKLHLILNSLIPYQVLTQGQGHDVRQGRAVMAQLRALPPEDNRIIRQYAQYCVMPANALEGQGLIGLHQQMCSQRRCLECGIGKQLVTGVDCYRGGEA